MIVVKGEYTYPNGKTVKLEFEMKDREKVFLTGKTGSGKSTLLRVLNGLIPKVYGGKLRGTVSIYGSTGNNISVFLITQYPEEQILCETVIEEVAFPLVQRGLEWKEAVEIAFNTLKKLKLEEIAEKKTFELSDGQKQAVIVCEALACDCKCIAIDELAHLHPDLVKNVVSYLLKDKRAIVLSEHRKELSEGFDRIVEVAGGGIELRIRKKRSSGKEVGKPLVIAKNAVVYRGNRKVIDQLSFTLKEGESLAVVGKNGAGKTSLLRAIAGFEKCKGVEVNGKVGMAFQYPGYGLSSFRVADETQYIEGLTLSERHPHSLSGGEKRLVAVLKALKYKIVLLDEPSAGMDEELRYSLIKNVIEICREERKAVIIATHDEKIPEMCDKVIEL